METIQLFKKELILIAFAVGSIKNVILQRRLIHNIERNVNTSSSSSLIRELRAGGVCKKHTQKTHTRHFT